jgi:hypothetical protein
VGFSFTYITALSASACALTWLLLERRPRTRELAFAALGAAVGLVPWLAYNGAHEFAGLARIAEVFGARAAPDLGRIQSLGERLADLFVRVPLFGVFDPSENALSPAGRAVVGVAALVPAGLALFAALVRAAGLLRARFGKGNRRVDERARRELVFVAYAFLFLLAYLLSRLILDPTPAPITYRLFPPLVVLLLLPIAASAERMLVVGGRTRRSALAACISGLTATATATYALAMRPPDSGAELSLTQGSTVLGRLLHRKFAVLSEAVAEARPVADAFSRERVLEGIGWEAQTRYEVSGDRQRLLDGIATLRRAERIAVLGGVLWGAGDRIRVISQRGNPSPRDVEDLERMRDLARTIEPMLTALKAEQKPGA